MYTTTSVNGARQTYGGFDFSVPTNNTITGFEVKIEASGSTAAGTISAKLSWDGGGSLTTAQTTGTLALTDGVFTLGSPSDTWGRVWTASELISFRLELIGNTSANTISVDAIQVKVYHQASGGGGRGGGMIYADPQHQYASVYSAFDAIKSSFDDFLRHLFWWLE